ncbi:MAG TPA: Mur ligase family protein [Victivallales bacterium]|nr:Mur ligase family protein [Victivallales bacterium]
MKIYFVGICGIGMSGIAQAFRSMGYDVAGSDREISEDGVNSDLLSYLHGIGIEIFPQNGTFIKKFHPDFIVYSTAIEENNPDFKCSQGVKRIHRSEALRMIIENSSEKISIAVTGVSGKTTVSAWIADALETLSSDPSAIIGGKSAKFAKNKAPGNFRAGKGRFLVIEADESDKSILNYAPDYAVILNTGPDHYPVQEQNEVFAKFARSAKKGLICSTELSKLISGNSKVPVACFGEIKNRKSGNRLFMLREYLTPKSTKSHNAEAVLEEDGKEIRLELPVPGIHNAINACAVLTTLSAIGLKGDNINAVQSFGGVARRFNILGRTSNGALVVDDYAHNPDKISSCILGAKELSDGKVFFIFQPHGYGPLGFMREPLEASLKKSLGKDDTFIMLPVFYAGGTSSFKPRSEEVIAGFSRNGIKNCEFRNSRRDAELLISKAGKNDVIVISGARDESLSTWAKNLAKKTI